MATRQHGTAPCEYVRTHACAAAIQRGVAGSDSHGGFPSEQISHISTPKEKTSDLCEKAASRIAYNETMAC